MNRSNMLLLHDNEKSQDAFQQMNRSPEGMIATAPLRVTPFSSSTQNPYNDSVSNNSTGIVPLMRFDTSNLMVRNPSTLVRGTDLSSTNGPKMHPQPHSADKNTMLLSESMNSHSSDNTNDPIFQQLLGGATTNGPRLAFEPRGERTQVASPPPYPQDFLSDHSATAYLVQRERHADDVLLALVAARHLSQQHHLVRMHRLQQELEYVQNLTALAVRTNNYNHLYQAAPSLLEGWNGMQQPNRTQPNELHQPVAIASSNNNSMRAPSHFSLVPRDAARRSIPVSLPAPLARPADAAKLSDHQYFLRQQIEVFTATSEDVATHIRGRNKMLSEGQVGLRCRHCKHLPIYKRKKGAIYFPFKIHGLYQSAQNMWTIHMQSGLCSDIPAHVTQEFERIMAAKNGSSSGSTGAGRPYWAHSARQFGLVDTEDAGIRFLPMLQRE